MKIFRNVALILLTILTVTIIFIGVYFNINISPVDKKDNNNIVVVIPAKTTTKEIGKILKKEGLIRNAQFFYMYAKIYKINDLKASTYELKKSMSLKEIITTLQKGNSYNPNAVTITFPEGINMRKVAKIIESKTNNSVDDVYNTLKDQKYLDELINKYWFLTDEIKNSDIYYSLEGYLYPDTYFLSSKDLSVKEIFNLMLDQMNAKLNSIKGDIEKQNMSVHKLLTIASIVELEGVTDEDRKGIAGVFYNRLNKNMSLGSDVTTYYAVKVELSERNLTQTDIDFVSPYNTRGPQMEGKVPVGPVSNPSVNSITSALYPTESNYYYFVADKNRKVYFTKTYNEHLAKIKELKTKGVWFEW